ncbi:MAG: helix-turn-helix transcriptional regulator [Kurthia sp.]|nr:helix-turn-helix transcriptional regulator [Candidatus Kurthia equi]
MDEISKKIRLLRKERELTLKDMSELTELSVGFLSQVERGTSSLAITSLKKIADALNVEMSVFFVKEVAVNYAKPIEMQKNFEITGSEAVYTNLSGAFVDRNLEAIKVIVPPLQADKISYSHTGEEFYYVLEGEIIFRINEEEFAIKKGESIHFPSSNEHMWRNPLQQETILLSVLTPTVF